MKRSFVYLLCEEICIFPSFVVRLVEMEMENGCQIFFSMATYCSIESSPAGNLLL